MDNAESTMQSTNAPAFITPTEAAQLLRVNERTVTRLCNDGAVKAVKVRKQWRINRAALFEYCGLAS